MFLEQCTRKYNRTGRVHGIQPLGGVYFAVHHAKNVCNAIVFLTF